MRSKYSICSGVAAALVAMAGVAPLAAADAARHWEAVTACAERPTDRSRHACLDAVLRDAGLLTPEREAKQQRDRFGRDQQAGTERASPSVAGSEQLEAQVGSASLTHDRKLVITTGDGAVWRQTEGAEVRPQPRAGDAMTIRRASMGSYICQVRDTLAFRCSRSR